ncbi:MAG: hypothetical protein AABX01_02545 [Candidatus Micrarchaeota archaeon]
MAKELPAGKAIVVAMICLILLFQPASAGCIPKKGSNGYPLGIQPNVTSIDVDFNDLTPRNFTFSLYIESEFGTAIDQSCTVLMAAISDYPALKVSLSRNSLETGAASNNKPITVFLMPIEGVDFPETITGSIKIADSEAGLNFVLLPINVKFLFPRPSISPTPMPEPTGIPFEFNDTGEEGTSPDAILPTPFPAGEEINRTIEELNSSGVDIAGPMEDLNEAKKLQKEGRMDQAKILASASYAELRRLYTELGISRKIFSWYFAAFIILLVALFALRDFYRISQMRKKDEETLNVADIYSGKGQTLNAISVELKEKEEVNLQQPNSPDKLP